MGIGEGGGWRHLSPLGSFWGLSPSRSPTLASHPLPNPNSSSPASRALSSITNNNDAYQIAWTYPTSSEPAPALPRGPLPRTRAFGVGGRISGARQAGLGTALYTPLCIRFAGKAPWGGVADASGFFLSVFVRYIYERIALGSGEGRCGPYPSRRRQGLGMSGITFPAPEPRPTRAPPLGSLRPRLSEAGPLPGTPGPALTLLPTYARLCQSLGGDPAPRARPIGRRLCDVTACSPNPPPVPSRGCPLPVPLS